MAEKDIFKQRPINPSEFEGAGEEPSGVEAMRAHLQGGVQMTGAIPPQISAAMQSDHPLHNAPPTMTEADALYQNARRLMKQGSQQQELPQQQPFNPNFEAPKFDPKDVQYKEFKDPEFEAIMGKLAGLTYDEIELPSKGKFYLRGEGPSNGVLHIRPMTGNEEQILTTPRYVKKNQALNMVFKECIGEQINPDMLLSEDRTFLLIYLRGISYSPSYDVEIKCPQCTKSFQNQIHLNNLMVDMCPDDFGPDDLVDTLPNSGLQVTYRLSTGRDETMVQEHRDQLVKQWGSEVADDSSLFRASLLVQKINTISNQLMIKQILGRLPIGDMAYLRELLNEPPFGVNTKVGIICPHCSHEFEVDMPMELGFFFPKPNLAKRKNKRA